MIPQERIQKFKDLTFSKENIMIPQEKIEQAEIDASEYSYYKEIEAHRDGFLHGVRFAEAELKSVAMEFAEWIFDNNFRMVLIANDKCYVRSSNDTTLILAKAALFAKFDAERSGK